MGYPKQVIARWKLVTWKSGLLLTLCSLLLLREIAGLPGCASRGDEAGVKKLIETQADLDEKGGFIEQLTSHVLAYKRLGCCVVVLRPQDNS